jgi:integrase/recombinase XerD
MNRAVEAYLADLEARRFSHSRRNHSAGTLERLLLYLRESHHVTDWRTVTLRQWLAIIRSFFLWLNLTGHLLHNPAERLAFPRREQPLPHVLNEADIARLIETPDTTTTLGLRDRALMEVLYATGIRHSELHKLDLYDVDTAAQQVIVRLGKGQRDRLIPLTETATHWLIRYLIAARPELAAGKLWGKGKRPTFVRATSCSNASM